MGDHGRVITIRWFGWMAAAAVCILVLAVTAGGLCYYLYRRSHDVNVRLQRSLTHAERQVSALRNEKDILTAQLVVARVELESWREKTAARAVPKAVQNRPAENRAAEPGPAAGVAPQSKPVAAERLEKGPAENLPAASAAAPKQAQVEVEGFSLRHEAENRVYRVQFILRKLGPETDPISGYTAVVLKVADAAAPGWLSLPYVELTAGVPTGKKKGQYFSIARFKTVSSSARSELDPARFNTATVFVFDEPGNLLLEKEFATAVQR